MFELWYFTNRGASQGNFYTLETDLIAAAKKLKRDAVIKKNGELHGRVWKMDGRWHWYVGEADPSDKRPDNAGQEVRQDDKN